MEVVALEVEVVAMSIADADGDAESTDTTGESVRSMMIGAMVSERQVLQWVRENGCVWDARACVEAARGGHVEVLQ